MAISFVYRKLKEKLLLNLGFLKFNFMHFLIHCIRVSFCEKPCSKDYSFEILQ